ncbi:late competence development ComFB family protein [Pseudodesulfovibrio indicus]|uniref:late competence development ComFB family protein n=1 Tax=Pseudodesulfovibrio indicus TaxID=1716143 RepID=UPI00292E0814|nr:late competence development ComFB family protein [Pseudodesulfovibrio indicus]
MLKQPLKIKGVDVSKIRNRNESRAADLIPQILDEYYEDYIFEDLDIQDIYALTLNMIPAGYAQPGSIVLSNRLSDYEIRSQIRNAVERVLDNPTRAGE